MFPLCITWRAWVLSWWMFCGFKRSFITTTASAIFWNIIQRHSAKSIFCLKVSPLSPSRLLVRDTLLLNAWWSWLFHPFVLSHTNRFSVSILFFHQGGKGVTGQGHDLYSRDRLWPWKFLPTGWKAGFCFILFYFVLETRSSCAVKIGLKFTT